MAEQIAWAAAVKDRGSRCSRVFSRQLLLAQIVGGLKGPAHQQSPGQFFGRTVRVVLDEYQIFQLFEVLEAQVPGKAGDGGL